VALVAFVAPHLSNVDVLPVTRKELREYILVSSCLRCGYLYPLLAPLLRACLFGLSVAGCPGKAAVQRKLLSRKSCCFEFHCLASWLAVKVYAKELSKIPLEFREHVRLLIV
jgi:hypothetical protein